MGKQFKINVKQVVNSNSLLIKKDVFEIKKQM